MPTVFELFGIRAFIIPGDHEPIHVHIECGDGFAKVQIMPDVKVIKQNGIKPAKMKKILNLVEDFRDEIVGVWKSNNSFNK